MKPPMKKPGRPCSQRGNRAPRLSGAGTFRQPCLTLLPGKEARNEPARQHHCQPSQSPPPQRDSLEILARLCDIVPLEKNTDIEQTLKAVQAEYTTVKDFERDFPSLCFALATGVGKTRLMGAFIAYLYKAEGIRHFFVLAPNLTIYNKLITDFTPNTPKYVFQGIADFAVEPPLIITGDNYETGLGVRREGRRQMGLGLVSTTASTSTSSTSPRSQARRRRKGPQRAASRASGDFRSTSARVTLNTCPSSTTSSFLWTSRTATGRQRG